MLLFSRKIGKTDRRGAGTTGLGRAVYGDPQQKGILFAGEFFWPPLSFLQPFNYSLQPANHPLIGGPTDPHLLTLNICYWKQGHRGNFDFGALGTKLSAYSGRLWNSRGLNQSGAGFLWLPQPQQGFLFDKDLDAGKSIQNTSQESSSVGRVHEGEPVGGHGPRWHVCLSGAC